MTIEWQRVGEHYEYLRREGGKVYRLVHEDDEGKVSTVRSSNLSEAAVQVSIHERCGSDALLHDERWLHEDTVYQGGHGSPRFRNR